MGHGKHLKGEVDEDVDDRAAYVRADKTFPHKTTKPNGRLEIDLGWSHAWHRFSLIGGPFDYFNGG
jgi:hypothetical protein